jgi:hypothetical protein
MDLSKFSTDYKTAFCIGNGESRLGFNLETLRGLGLIIGCNALYRDFSPDILVSVDRPIQEEIRANYKGFWVYRKPEHTIKLKDSVEIGPIYGAGSMAVLIAALLGCQTVYLVGYDFNRIMDTKEQNNVYKNTPNYFLQSGDKDLSEKTKTDIGFVIARYRHIKFIFVNDNQKEPYQWEEYITYLELNKRITNAKPDKQKTDLCNMQKTIKG